MYISTLTDSPEGCSAIRRRKINIFQCSKVLNIEPDIKKEQNPELYQQKRNLTIDY